MWISHENRAEYSFLLVKKGRFCAILLARVPTTTQDAQASQQHATFALEKQVASGIDNSEKERVKRLLSGVVSITAFLSSTSWCSLSPSAVNYKRIYGETTTYAQASYKAMRFWKRFQPAKGFLIIEAQAEKWQGWIALPLTWAVVLTDDE
mgnify:CR=1 FL=1